MSNSANTLSDAARRAIFNFLDGKFFPHVVGINSDYWEELHKNIGAKFLHLSHDEVIYVELMGSRLSLEYREDFNTFLLSGEEEDVIKLLVFLLKDTYKMQNLMIRRSGRVSPIMIHDIFCYHINDILADNNVGYKIVDLDLVPLTDDLESHEIEQALAMPYGGAKQHLNDALHHLSSKEYFKSMNESMLAVESAAKELTNEDTATLANCIRVFKNKGIILHPAFEQALSKLYAFTKDNPGMSHARIESREPLQEDRPTARFMLVTCSAFVNYIIANAPDDEG